MFKTVIEEVLYWGYSNEDKFMQAGKIESMKAFFDEWDQQKEEEYERKQKQKELK